MVLESGTVIKPHIYIRKLDNETVVRAAGVLAFRRPGMP